MSVLFPRSDLGRAHRKSALFRSPASPRRSAASAKLLAPVARSPRIGKPAAGAHVQPAGPPGVHFNILKSSSRGRKAPHLSLADLERHRDALMVAALAPSTRRGYASGLKHWTSFAKIYHQDLVPSATSLPLFAAFLSRRLKHPNTVLSAVAAQFKPSVPGWDAIRFSPAMASVLAGAAKQPHAPTRRSEIGRAHV